MTKTDIILAVLEHSAEATPELLRLYGNISYGEAVRGTGHISSARPAAKLNWSASHEEIQKFHSILSHLRATGLVSKSKRNGVTFWKITGKGLKKIRKTKEKASFSEIFSRRQNMADGAMKIVTFDVPERERKKRAWLRSMLSLMGFSLLHRSVWQGRGDLPNEFFVELHKKKILRCVRVFAVAKSGAFESVDLKK